MRNSSRSNWIGGLTLVLIAGGSTSAHRRDEYLQAARLGIDLDRVHLALDLTPGIAGAEGVLAEIDLDGNKSISAGEAQAYSGRLLSAIAVDVDGTPLVLDVIDSAFPEVDAVLNGEGTMRIHAVASVPRLGEGLHHLRYRNSHRPDIGVYLANALVPDSDRVTVAAQRRDGNQRELIVDFVVRADPAARTRRGLSVGVIGVFIWLATLCWRRSRQPHARSL